MGKFNRRKGKSKGEDSNNAVARSSRGKQVVVKDLPSDSLAIVPAPDVAPAISSFVVDPGYSGDNDQGIRGVANGTTPFLLAAVSVNAPLDAVP